MTTDRTLGQLPDEIGKLAAACNLTVSGWDSADDSALVHGPDVNYIGSKAEVVAFLTAWSQCQQIKITRAMTEAEEAPGVRYGFVSWDAGPIAPNQSAPIVARPQTRVFRGERVAIPDEIAEHFLILDIRVGTKSVFLRSGPVDAKGFAMRISDSTPLFALSSSRGDGPHEIVMAQAARLEFGRSLSFPPCMAAQDLVIVVENIATDYRAFRGIVLGKYAW